MSKRTKKRTKKYQGEDAATPVPKTVRRYTAVQRSPSGEWWHTHKKRIRVIAIISGVVAFITLIISELVRLIF
jgi:hypothetical protein